MACVKQGVCTELKCGGGSTSGLTRPMESQHEKTRNRDRLSAENKSLALFLNKAWDKCRKMGLQGAVDEMYDGCDEEEIDE